MPPESALYLNDQLDYLMSSGEYQGWELGLVR